jgi:hypothetical protein
MSFIQALNLLKIGDKVPYFAPFRKSKNEKFTIDALDQKALSILPASGKGEPRRIPASEYDRVCLLLPAVYTQSFDRNTLKTQHSSYIIAIEQHIRNS